MSKTANLASKKGLISNIVKDYNTLAYGPQLLAWLGSIYPDRDFSSSRKFNLHKTLNEAFVEHYDGEFKYKYSLFKRFQNHRLIAAFEMRVNKSRVDFLTINGHTTSFEIKSTIDNLAKLEKQADDYLAAFEYNNVIIDQKHLDSCRSRLPQEFGIIIYKNGRLRSDRKASLNTNIKADIQLKLLTKKELMMHFQTDDVYLITSRIDGSTINSIFKQVLKKRYKERWKFVVTHSSKILPIDLQFFFNTNILPETIYR